jgi:translation initiation factor IF-1
MAIEESAEMVGVVIVLLGVLTAVRVRWADQHLTLAYADGRVTR